MSMAEARAVPWPDDWRQRIVAVLPQHIDAAAGS